MLAAKGCWLLLLPLLQLAPAEMVHGGYGCRPVHLPTCILFFAPCIMVVSPIGQASGSDSVVMVPFFLGPELQ